MKTSLVDDAYERLKAEILENRMPPGFQGTEPEIALRLGMSRTPVREALLKLESDGLVELVPRRGARVLPISLDDMREIYSILSTLESEAAACLAKQEPSLEMLVDLEKATKDMEKALLQDDLDAWAEADERFHRKLLVLSGNKRLNNIVGTMFDQGHRVRMMTLRLRKRPDKSTKEHRKILEHIISGDPDKARRACRKHRERAAKELLTIIEQYKFLHL